ncbi:MAG TPA: dihydrofolate reductase family protein [Nitrospiria bacterium]|nr:dihydrofolate reductase family protein [Nitrospiria bacterium]
MGKIKVAAFSVSMDGFAAGPDQSLENPLGVRGPELFGWFFPTKVFNDMHGNGGGTTGVDNQFGERSFQNMGAWILGRNMFGPIRGPWPDESWKGWWGTNPPYHVPTFVLTHHARPPLEMEGGTRFIFVTDGIQSALQQARKAAGDKDVRIGGGVSTIRQYLQAGLIDDMHLALMPVLMGKGENLFSGLDLNALGFKCVERVSTEQATHVVLKK